MGLPTSEGKYTILTIVDGFSKVVHFMALAKLPSATETADLDIEHVVRIHEIPLDIVSDRGPQFTSRVWKEFCRALGATASLSSSHPPQSNGQTERANQDLETALRCISAHNPASLSCHLTWVEYSHNSLTSSATGMTPSEASFDYLPPLFPSQEIDVTFWQTGNGLLLQCMSLAKRLDSTPETFHSTWNLKLLLYTLNFLSHCHGSGLGSLLLSLCLLSFPCVF